MKKKQIGAELEKVHISFSWIGGVISNISGRAKWSEINKKHSFCAVCGEQKLLNFEKLSGGQKVFLCTDCAERYVERAIELLKTEPTLSAEEVDEKFTEFVDGIKELKKAIIQTGLPIYG